MWALARMNDPRCVPGLVELLAGEPSGFTSAHLHHPAVDWHTAVLPALDEVLHNLVEHAEALMPAICIRLTTARDHLLTRLCKLLADWGPFAAAAVPQLLHLLEDDQTWQAAATALAGIGEAGSEARELLMARARTGGSRQDLAAWASWKVGGDPEPALEVLGPAVTEGFCRPAMAMLADFGPYAAPHADRLLTLIADEDPWTSITAAHALWAATGDTTNTVPALTTVVRDLAQGVYRPVMLPAVRHLVRIGGTASQPTASILRGVPALDQRLRTNGGWRGFTQDEEIRAAVNKLLTALDRPV